MAPAGPHDRLVDVVRTTLAAAGDPVRAEGQQRYMKSTLPFHGVPLPTVRRLLRPLIEAHPLEDRPTWEATVRSLWDDATHREERYAATTLARHRHSRRWQDRDTLGLYRHLIVTGAWRDHVDEIAAHLVGPILRADPQGVAPLIRRWARDEDMWVRRAAVLAQLGAATDTDTALLEDCLTANLVDSRFGTEFFIRKAVGWALRDYAKTDPDWVRDFLTRHHDRLSPLSRREAAKHLG